MNKMDTYKPLENSFLSILFVDQRTQHLCLDNVLRLLFIFVLFNTNNNFVFLLGFPPHSAHTFSVYFQTEKVVFTLIRLNFCFSSHFTLQKLKLNCTKHSIFGCNQNYDRLPKPFASIELRFRLDAEIFTQESGVPAQYAKKVVQHLDEIFRSQCDPTRLTCIAPYPKPKPQPVFVNHSCKD